MKPEKYEAHNSSFKNEYGTGETGSPAKTKQEMQRLTGVFHAVIGRTSFHKLTAGHYTGGPEKNNCEFCANFGAFSPGI
ncbi:MAG: hypothetical protein ACLUFI_12580 [Oscillospiraceae bacterium]